ncbi:MAG TPA: fibronectin type III domain-containing protein [Candidatus Limnocylindria bacterium]|nr:fibronectin type III domain-containing protein [Candidatus Limnocylindria bacterium]
MKLRRYAALILCAVLLAAMAPRAEAAQMFTTPVIYWVSSLSGTALKVYWHPSTGAVGIEYMVERAPAAAGPWAVAKMSTTLTEFTNYFLTPGTAYFFRVTASREIMPGIWASSPPSKVVGGVPLAKPTGVAVTPVSSSVFRVSWNAVPHATGYGIFRGLSKTGPFTFVGSTTALSKQIFGHTPGVFYYYFVWGTKTIGSATYTGAPASAQGITFAVPAISGIVSAGAMKAKVTWGAIAGATGYELWRRKGSSGAFSLAYTGSLASFTDAGLTPGAAYHYRVRPFRRVFSVNYYGLYSPVKTYTVP